LRTAANSDPHRDGITVDEVLHQLTPDKGVRQQTISGAQRSTTGMLRFKLR
jgi:hypothetical protein